MNFAHVTAGCACVVVLAALPQLAAAATVTLLPAKDNTIFSETSAELSSGAGDSIFVGTNTRMPTLRRGLIEFDVAAAVPAGAVVSSVTLTMNMSRTNGTPATIGIYRTTSEWGEGASDSGPAGNGAAATTLDATWIHSFFDTTLWSAQGGDFSPTASGSVAITSTGFYTWGSTALMVSDVQAWLNTPADNHGWLLKDVGELVSGTAKRFDSRENAIVENRPVLTVEFSTVPEPSSWILIVAGAVGLLSYRVRCRRRNSAQAYQLDGDADIASDAQPPRPAFFSPVIPALDGPAAIIRSLGN